MSSPRTVKVIDLCSGAGGWACAARGLPMEVVMAVDFWEPACRTYRLNHPDALVLHGDLQKDENQVRVLDVATSVQQAGDPLVIVGGIPCEWLSPYRALKTVEADEREDQRATLDSVLDLVETIQPDKWCLEDVVALIRELPLMTPYHVLDACHWSPQRRKRVFVGDFPVPPKPDKPETRTLKDVLRPGPYRIGRRAADRPASTNRTFSRRHALAAEGRRKAPTICNLSSRRDAELVVVDPSWPGGKRQLEWQEAAAAQGFPSDYVFYGSPTDVYLQICRAIQIDLGRAILRAICDSLLATGPSPEKDPNDR